MDYGAPDAAHGEAWCTAVDAWGATAADGGGHSGATGAAGHCGNGRSQRARGRLNRGGGVMAHGASIGDVETTKGAREHCAPSEGARLGRRPRRLACQPKTPVRATRGWRGGCCSSSRSPTPRCRGCAPCCWPTTATSATLPASTFYTAQEGHSALPHRPHRRCGRAADGEPAAAVHCAVRPHAPRAAVSRADAGPPARVPRVQQPQRRARLPLPGAEAACPAPLGAAAAAAAAAASTCGTARVECSSSWPCCRRPAIPSARLGFGGSSHCCLSPSSARQAWPWHVQELAQDQVVSSHAERPAMRPCASGRPSAAALFRVRQERLLLPP